jgi:uncharacterized protein (TIGR00255 family)
MISSMTGFGKSIVQENGIVVETEIRSLNSRFLDIYLRIPKSISSKEFELREKIKSRIIRGKLSVSINIKKEGNNTKENLIDNHGLKTVLALLQEIKSNANVKGKVSLDNVLMFQNLFISEAKFNSDIEYQFVEKSVSDAIDDLIKMRKQEGEVLAKDVLIRISNIDKSVDKIQNTNKESIPEYFNKLKERAKQLLSEFPTTDQRLDVELALLAEKYDVTEECVRLKSHIKMFSDTLNSSQEAGRKLNFLCQEMNREANTINSKSISTEVSYEGIYIKEELEKIREQIQNIE